MESLLQQATSTRAATTTSWKGSGKISSQLVSSSALSPEDGEDYPGTRLADVLLNPKSKIDYIMASGRTNGLIDELAEPFALVRHDLLPTNLNTFRLHLSDHIPVTIRIRVVTDDDP